MGTSAREGNGEAAIAKFARKHAVSRKPLKRFSEVARAADWPRFPATDYAPSTGTLIFEIGGNRYRLVARVDFEERVLYIQSVMTHQEYDREDL